MIDTGKTVIILSKKGRIIDKKVVNESLRDTIKKVAKEALEKWEPFESGFDIIPYEHEVEKPLPLKPEEVDIILKLNPIRMKDRVLIKIPMFIVSYKNYRMGEQTIDEEVYVVAPYITDEYIKIIEEIAVLTTSEEAQQ
ncbi:DUF2286 domain-containing protein [Desulfurococcaceae archaeon MEX13E-LK6-19]|nr:DUF2286 domain-containing protein [Desulfurococcaceae archaeon MEX13E-LK6-19]